MSAATPHLSQQNAERLIARARTQLIVHQPFFGSLALRLRLVSTPGLGTLATDSVSLFYDPAFVETLSGAELQAVVAHEVMHCVLGHPWRRAARTPLRWNVAADLGVNPIIVSAGKSMTDARGATVMTLPKGALMPAAFGFEDDSTAEDYYNRLPKQQKCACTAANGNGAAGGGVAVSDPDGEIDCPNGGHGGCGGVRDLPGRGADGTPDPTKPATAADVAAASSNWKIATVQAAQTARQAGKLPASIARMVDELTRPSVDWKEVLRRFITASLPCDYRMFPPNRRFIWRNLYLPSVQRDGVGVGVVAVDTSGSVGQRELTAFVSEINGIMEDARPERLHVVCCDAEIGSTAEYTPDELPIRVDAVGGGGTAFDPVFAWIEASGIAPAFVIYLTDMYPSSWPDEPEYPVLWAAVTDVIGPWGETVRVRLDGDEED